MNTKICAHCGTKRRGLVHVYAVLFGGGASVHFWEHGQGHVCPSCRAIGRDFIRTDRPWTDEEAAAVERISSAVLED